MFWKMWLYMKWLLRLRRARLCLAAAVAAALCAEAICYARSSPAALSLADVHARLRESILDQLGAGCEAPRLDPFSEEAMKDDYDQPKVRCENTDWVRCHISECFVIEEVLKKFTNIYCIYKDVLYINDYRYVMGDPVKLVGSERYTLKNSDIVRVSCRGAEVGAFLPVVWVGHLIGLRKREVNQTRDKEYSEPPLDPCKRLNVMILGFHTASRNRFTRRMPKSLKVLTEELNATMFNIHNIVGDGKAAALFPLLIGKSELELSNTREKISKRYIDVKNLLFHIAKINGFQTAFFEDAEYIGTFQKHFNGFSRQPADHYLRAFHLDAIHESNWLTSFQHKPCVGSIPLYRKILQLTQQFAKLEREYFSLSLIGQIYNDPYNLVQTVDDDVSAFLRGLKETGALQNTLLMVLGDHGPNIGRFRETYQGKLEERLPLMALVLPKKTETCRPNIVSTVKANSMILTTHFDVHATALDAMGLQEYADGQGVGARGPRAHSLLRPVPAKRTCGEAGVLPHWCACAQWRDVPNRNPLHAKVGNFLAEFINNLTIPVRNVCIDQKLASIVWVMRQNVKKAVFKNEHAWEIDYENLEDDVMRPSKEYYQAKIVLSPSDAVFEGTVAHAAGSGALSLRAADVSRVSAYGDETACVADDWPDLIKYCYCVQKHKYLFSYKGGLAMEKKPEESRAPDVSETFAMSQSREQILPEKASATAPDAERAGAGTDPHAAFVTHPTSYLETMLHIFRGNIGSGLLAMGDAFRNGGLVFGTLATVALGIICVHAQHILLNCAEQVRQDTKGGAAPGFADTVRLVFLRGGPRLRRHARLAATLVDVFLCVTQLGFCCVYIVFIANNIKLICDHYNVHIDLSIHMIFVVIPVLLACMVRNLKFLTPFSTIANVLMAVGVGVVVYQASQELPPPATRDYIASWQQLPLYFGTAVYAFEGIGLVLPLKNEMRDPEEFQRPLGVLNVSMAAVGSIFVVVGFLGYLRWGDDVQGSLTLNLPPDLIISNVVQTLIALAILFTYPLQFHVPAGIMWGGVRARCARAPPAAERGFRALLVLLTFALAESVPQLGLVISLVGAVSSTALALVFPPLIELVSVPPAARLTRAKDAAIIALGLFIFVTGTYESVASIIRAFRH